MVLSWYLLIGFGIALLTGSPIDGECWNGGRAKAEITIGRQLIAIPLSPGGPYNTSGGPVHGDPRIINVHLVPHTHNDVGWLKTVDQYATGANNSIQIANVGLILDSVINALEADKNRKFIYVEMAFFIRWWRRQSKAKKRLVRKLVGEGRLEFINAGWVMNDEAATMYTDIIDQHTNGALQVIREFGLAASPRIGWQIDPFGHSSFQNKAFRGMAFDGWLVGRADDQDMAVRKATGALEMVYRTDESSSSASEDAIFMGLMYMYSPPPGFGFDVLNGDPPLQDDVLLEDVNIADRLAAFREICVNQTESYNPDGKGEGQSKNIILTMGMDFNYQQAISWYNNMDKLIHYSKLIAAQQRCSSDVVLNLFYSNPRIYIQSRHQQYREGKDLPTKASDEDFFPYGDGKVDVIDVHKRTVDPIDGGHAYWTGYFTSRPNFKGMVRGASRTYTAARQLVATAIHKAHVNEEEVIAELTDAIGLAQHHDAITGTEKQHVDDDYSKRLHIGTEKVMNSVVIPEVLSRFDLKPESGGHCPLLNESICSWTTNLSGSSVLVAVYNSLSHPSASLVTVPVGNNQPYDGLSPEELRMTEIPMMRRLKGGKGRFMVQKAVSKEAVKSWLVPNLEGSYSLQFMAEDVPPLGATIYRITSQPSTTTQQRRGRRPHVKSISNERYEISYDDEKGDGNYMFKLKNIHHGVEVKLNISFGYYESSNGSGPLTYGRPGQASGAYIFRPNCPENPRLSSIANCRPKAANFTPILLSSDDGGAENMMRFAITHPSVDDGQQQQQQPDDIVGHLTLQVAPKQAVVSISWDVAIYINGGAGKEVVLLVDSDISNNDGDFMTDSNGRDWIHRKVNYRSGWQLNVTDPVAMNYYPINSGLRIVDQEEANSAAATRMLTLITDRAHGGASLLPGQMEIMVHRRCLNDDARGVDEPLDETICYNRICLPKNVIGQTQLLLEPMLKEEGERADSDEYREQAHLARLPLLPVFARDDPEHQPKSDSWSSLQQPADSSQIASSTLPREVQILTLQLLNNNNTPSEYYKRACAQSRCLLLRLAHTYAPGEGSTSVVHLNLAAKGALLEGFTLGKAIEVTLNAGRYLKTAEEERLRWSTSSEKDASRNERVFKNEVDCFIKSNVEKAEIFNSQSVSSQLTF
ncbi:hypothetical protein FOL47_009372 [Perkinsus chesapeaki]|uniref:Alpha-mannosidase n=1 Tax=Perkinsus chesapeaki TaxID=330153 RepID=A0A7J6MT13_PERCH|nr:hypothetical protein FOL47_009372 [Perkinsus chesapeaki]